MSRLVCTLPRLVGQNARTFTRGQVRMADPKIVKEINLRQAKFQEDPQPEYMKLGKIHFYTTTVLGIVVVIAGMRSLYLLTQ